MRKRLLSLFLAVVMVVLAVPTLAIVSLAAEAGEGEAPVYSTTFTSDPHSKNFPVLDLPAAIPEDDPDTLVKENNYNYLNYYYGGIGTYNEDGTFKNAGYAANVVNWQGN